ncbi:CO6A3-like protein [Mya arenaria]|uniref:CO6A3-like protein n=1 Tax=Mya arenaria TaxID=6604 RepID=A0ABY7EIS6_MYAAR|nr:CO6A3-like protein [Mya arenaria]
MTTRQRLFTTTTTPVGLSEVADIVLLVHLSPRITEMEFITVQEFLKSLVSRADIANGKAQIGLVFYGADPEIIFHINQYNDIALMQKSIDGMRADLRSYTSDASTAIASAKQMLSPYFNRRDDVPAAMIFIADDPANTNFDVMVAINFRRDRYLYQNYFESACSKIQIDLIFLLDSSSSMGRSDFQNMKNFLKYIVSQIDITGGTSRIGAYTFNTRAKSEFHLNDYTTNEAVLDAIDDIPQNYGNTNTAAALRALREGFTEENGDRPNIRNVGVLITDGQANMETRRTVPEAILTKEDNIFIYAFGVKLREYSDFKQIPSPPVARNAIFLQTFEDLASYGSQFMEQLCADCPPPVLDVVFIVDSSTSVGFANFKKMLNFVKLLLEDATIDQSVVRVGLMTFNTNPKVRFHLNEIENRVKLINEIEKVPYEYGNTNTADALKTMRTEMFTEQNGDRKNVKNLAVIITDGISNMNNLMVPVEAETARDGGIQIMAIGIQLQNLNELDSIASRPLSDNRFAVDDFSKLTDVRTGLFPKNCIGSDSPVGLIAAPANDVNKLCGIAQFDMVIVLDSSTSVQPRNWKTMLQATQNFVRGLDIDNGHVRIGIVVFSNDARSVFYLNTYTIQNDIINAISSINYTYGQTNLADALKLTRNEMFTELQGDRPDIPNIAVIVTDGKSTINSNRTIPEAMETRRNGIQIYAIGIGITDIDTEELDEITGSEQNRYFIDDFDELEQKMESIYKTLCPVCTRTDMDLVFVLDSSTSLTEAKFKVMLAATRNFISRADIDSGNTRVAVITYSTRVRVEFDLNSYDTKEELLSAIENIEYVYGDTNTADAIKTMRTRSFNKNYGDRENISNVGVIITDGVSNINSLQTIPEAKQARREGIEIFAIGVGVSQSKELDEIAGSKDHRFDIENFEEVEYKLDAVFKRLCSEGPATNNYGSMCTGENLDVVFVLDSSTSMGKDNFRIMLEAAKSFVTSTDIDNGHTRIGVLIFSTGVSIEFNLGDYKTERELINAIDDIQYMAGSTNTSGAIRVISEEMFLAKNGARTNSGKIGIVITDGVSNIDYHKVIPEANAARQKGILLLAIGVGLNNTKELDDIAGIPENRININDFEELEWKLDQFFRAVCNACGHTELDIVFIMDISDAVPDSNFNEAVQLMHNFASSTNIDSDRVRVGLLSYNTSIFHLNSYTNKTEVLEAIKKAKRPSLDVDIAETLYFLRNVMFTPYYGDRRNTQNIAVMVSDGQQNFERLRVRNEIQKVNKAGIRLFSVGVNVPNKRNFGHLAAQTTRQILVSSFAELPSTLETMYDIICSGMEHLRACTPEKSYRLYKPTLWVLPNNVSLYLRVIYGVQRLSTGIAQFVFCVLDPNKCSLGNSDLVIILDASTSVTQQNYDKMLQFTKDLLQNADIDSGAVRVGILIYSTEVQVIFNLNEYSRKADVFAAIDKIPYIYGSTNTADALQTMHAQMFTPRNGDRPNVPNTGIIITDGTFDELVGLDRKIFSALCPETSCGLSSVDVVIIIDASTSVTEPNFKLMLEFCKDIVKGADIDSGSVRVGVLIYSTEVEIQFHLNRYSTNAQVIDAIDKIPYIYGSTNTADALLTMHQTMFTPANGDRQGVENVAIVLTDVEGMASEPKDKYLYNVRRFEELQGLEEDIFGAGEGGDCATPAPATPAPATLAPKTECGLSKVDAVIILDASTSVTEPNFKKMLSFCKEIVDKAAIDSGSVRIGVLIYSTEVEIEFHLNKYTNTADIKAAIDRIPYIYGSTNSADALKTMHEVMFTARNGDRPDVDNIAFMITDGISNINGRRTIPEAENAQGKDIRVYAIGIGLTDTRELEGMASEPKSENMFNVREFDELTGLIDTIFGGAEECALSEPPVANAGPDVTRRYPSGTITLDGRRSSDDNGIVTYTWSQGGRDLFTGATFDLYDLREGEYEYNLTVVDEDGQSDSDTVRVIIEAEDFPPNANAGDDVTIQLPVNSVRLDGRYSSDDVAVVQYMWKLTNGQPGVSFEGDDSATPMVDNLEEGEYTFTLTVADALGQTDDDTVNVYVKAQDFPPKANAGDDVTIQLPVDSVLLDGRKSSDDIAIVQYMWKLTNGQPGVSLEGDESARLMVEDLEEGEYTFTLTVTDALGQTDDDTVNVYVKAQDFPPKANAGDDVTIQLPVDSVLLDGRQSSDDIAVVKYSWKLTTGPQSVSLEGQDSPRLMVEGLEEGEYAFTLTVSDVLGQTDDDTVNVYVKALDAPPRADAGEDKTVKLPIDSILLDGSKSSDDRRIVKYVWNILSSSSDDLFLTGVNSPRLLVENLAEGKHVFELSVYDALGQEDIDTTTVYVTGQDFPPRADAGEDITIKFPKDNVELDGTRSSDDIKVVRYSWALSGGEPGNVRLGDVDASTLRAEFAQPGSYTFNLTVYDGAGQMDQDSVNVVVEVSMKSVLFNWLHNGLSLFTFNFKNTGCGLAKTDLVFILDASTSVTDANFQKMRDFLKEFLSNADIDSGSVRVGVNIYSTDVQVEFHLNRYTKAADVMSAIDNIPYIYGSTNTADALQSMANVMFTPQNGDRPDAPNVCILLTDGVSNINSRRTIPEAERARAKNVHLYVIGIGLTDTREVTAIATPPASKNLFSVNSFDELKGLHKTILNTATCKGMNIHNQCLIYYFDLFLLIYFHCTVRNSENYLKV